ncbi:MAG: UbiA family prenyltransferase [Alphaproteobacteria bacterium]
MLDIKKPLIVDIDGSLLRTYLLMENFWRALGIDFFATLWIAFTSFWKPAKLKRKLAQLIELKIALMPVNDEVLQFCRDSENSGRTVILASGSDQILVDALALHLGIAGAHMGSDGVHSLTGRKKAKRLVAEYGEDGFDYIGNEARDIKVWKHARNIIVVSPSKSLASTVEKLGKPVQTIGEHWSFTDLLHGIRPYQWVKNLLLLLPVIAAHKTGAEQLLPVAIAMASFSAGASAIYIVNDLLDLEADRLHPKKKLRPFAAGTVPLRVAMIASIGLGLIALGLGFILGWGFLGVVSLYMATSLAYSLRLKRMRWVDIFTLAWLYTLRVLAGVVAAGVLMSGWLVIFVFAAFLSLGGVKRMTELAKANTKERLPGRGYAIADMGDLLNVSGIGAFSAIAIFLAYTFSPSASGLYSNLWELRLASVPIAIWLIRMIRLGWQGKQDYDPIVFASRDKWGLGLALIGLALLLHAV